MRIERLISILALAAFAVVPFQAHAQPKPPMQGNDVPLFEGVTKTPQEIAADAQFIKEAVAAAGTKEKAAEAMIDRGWKAIQAGDSRTAIHRFNQASLLAPRDHRVFWGLGVASGSSGDAVRAERLFRQGAPFAGTDGRYYCDFGFAIQNLAIGNAQRGVDPRAMLGESESLYTKCRDLAPQSALPYSRLAISAFYRQDCAGTKLNIGEAQKRGGEGLDPRLLQDVSTHCK